LTQKILKHVLEWALTALVYWTEALAESANSWLFVPALFHSAQLSSFMSRQLLRKVFGSSISATFMVLQIV